MLVHSPKTEHHPNGKTRMVPLFPELRSLLMEVFEAAQEGDQYVITKYRDATANLRTQFNRIIKRAGLIPWVKPWQNLRSSRETELLDSWPDHVVCAWIGNSKAVAREHFKKAAQNPAQYQDVTGGTKQKGDSLEDSQPDDLQDDTSKYCPAQVLNMGRAGFEPA
jgi:hypothetical protein